MRFPRPRFGLTAPFFALAVTALAADPPAKSEDTARPLYAGAAAVFSLDAATVVYPVDRDKERTAAAQRSAEHRAAFLRYHGIDASAARPSRPTVIALVRTPSGTTQYGSRLRRILGFQRRSVKYSSSTMA